jgi:hypothetical protein
VLAPTGKLSDDGSEGKREDVEDGVLEEVVVDDERAKGVVFSRREVVELKDVNVDDWEVVGELVEEIVGTMVSVDDVVDRLTMLDVMDDPEEDIEEAFAEREGTVDDGTDTELTTLEEVVVVKPLQVVRTKEPRKLNCERTRMIVPKAPASSQK